MVAVGATARLGGVRGVVESSISCRAIAGALPSGEGGPGIGLVADGRQLAFSRESSIGQADIMTMSASGKRLRRVTHLGGMEGQPDWSPDGRSIAFIHEQGPYFARSSDVLAMRPDGSHLRAAAANKGLSFSPSWSSDGRLAWYSDGRGRSILLPAQACGSSTHAAVASSSGESDDCVRGLVGRRGSPSHLAAMTCVFAPRTRPGRDIAPRTVRGATLLSAYRRPRSDARADEHVPRVPGLIGTAALGGNAMGGAHSTHGHPQS